MNKNLIDMYGELSQQIKALEEKQKELKEKITKEGVGTYRGDRFELTVYETVRETYNPRKVLNKIGQANFMKVISVSASKVKQYIDPMTLQKMVESVKTSTSIRVKELDKK